MIEEKMEYFQEMKLKALSGKKGNRDLILISAQDNQCGAKIYDSYDYRIKNALIFVRENGEQMRWKLTDGEIEECPTRLGFCVKGLDKMAVCVGDEEIEESYHILDMEGEENRDFCILGTVEIEKYTVGFYVDWKTGSRFYLQVTNEYGEESCLYALMTKMYEQGVIINGAEDAKTNRQLSGERNQTVFGNQGW